MFLNLTKSRQLHFYEILFYFLRTKDKKNVVFSQTAMTIFITLSKYIKDATKRKNSEHHMSLSIADNL